MTHNMLHALRPVKCSCDMKDIHICVMCSQPLKAEREHVDTCGRRCYAALFRLQQDFEL